MSDLDGYRRYAVYFAPAADAPFGRLGAAWLGRDARSERVGGDASYSADASLEALRRDVVATPARYGFHATLKAPFRLTESASAAELDAAVAAFAVRTPAAAAPKLRVADHHGFLSLTPSGPAPDVDALAFAVVTAFEPFRAPLDENERARRLAAGLDARELELLEKWGYPYVAERFQFHMTLTSRLSPAASDDLADALAPAFDEVAADPFLLDRLCVFGDPGDGAPFRLLSEHPLTG